MLQFADGVLPAVLAKQDSKSETTKMRHWSLRDVLLSDYFRWRLTFLLEGFRWLTRSTDIKTLLHKPNKIFPWCSDGLSQQVEAVSFSQGYQKMCTSADSKTRKQRNLKCSCPLMRWEIFFFQRKPSKPAVVCLCSSSIGHPKALKEKLALNLV